MTPCGLHAMTDMGWQTDRSMAPGCGSLLLRISADAVRQAEGLPDRQIVMNASRPQILVPAVRCESFTQAAKNNAQHVHRRCGTVVGWAYGPSHRLSLAVVAEGWGG